MHNVCMFKMVPKTVYIEAAPTIFFSVFALKYVSTEVKTNTALYDHVPQLLLHIIMIIK